LSQSGEDIGVIEVLEPRPESGFIHIEIATFRSDGAYDDGRRPVSVTFSSPEEDAKRRDFTINGMFFDPLAEQILDYVGGREDLAGRIVRANGYDIGVLSCRSTLKELRTILCGLSSQA
jgi:poly(A) polymerase